VAVRSFSPDSATSPAGRSGIQLGDVIVAVNDKEIDRVATLQRTIRSHDPGSTVNIKVIRGGEPRTVRVRLDERRQTASAASATSGRGRVPSELTFDRLGVSVEVVTPQWLQQNGVSGSAEGLRVTDMAPGRSSADKLRGMILTEVIRPGPPTLLRTEADLEKLLGRVRDGEIVTFRGHLVQPGAGDQLTLSPPQVVNVRIGS
jgi:serine protease Do